MNGLTQGKDGYYMAAMEKVDLCWIESGPICPVYKKILQINDIHGYVTKMGDYNVFNEKFSGVHG
jgi:hypothetical protein